jgi:hypothetical protein
VRRTCPQEKDVTTYTLTDEELQSYLDDEGAVWQLAAANALDDLASNQSYILKITTNSAIGISVNGVAVAQDLRNKAAELRQRYDDIGSSDFAGFDVAETDWESLI